MPLPVSVTRRASLAAGVVALSTALLWPSGTAAAGPLSPDPPPLPPPADTLDTAAVARLDWSVPERFGKVWSSWNSGRADYDPKVVTPTAWSLTLNGCASTSVLAITRYEFSLAQIGTSWRRTFSSARCSLPLTDLPAQGAYTATLKLRTSAGAGSGVSRIVQRPVTIRDYLIVSMGDSVAAGEGNPDKAGSYRVRQIGGKVVSVSTRTPARWQDRRCHRSARSGPALAARSYEAASDKTSVTFVSFACSGASIKHLVSSSYRGLIPRGSTKLAPQVRSVSRLVGPTSPRRPRTIDALMITAGANDVDWSAIVRRCAANPNVGNHTSCVRADGLAGKVTRLSRSYAELARALRPLAAREIYLNTYPANAFRGAGCDIFSLPGVGIDGPESRELFTWGKRVNARIAAAAHRYRSESDRWNLVGDLTEPFSPHAYCDRPSWFRSYRQSYLRQGDEYGTLHPNALGHAAFRDLLRSAVVLDQPRQSDRTVIVRITQLWARPQTRYPIASIRMTLRADLSGHTVSRLTSIRRNGTWTSVPSSAGQFVLPVYLPRATPRHAIGIDLTLDHAARIRHDRFDNYGAGSHQISWDGGRYRANYTVQVLSGTS